MKPKLRPWSEPIGLQEAAERKARKRERKR